MAKNVNTATEPKIEHQPEQGYMGIRIQTPYGGMRVEIDKIRKELEAWLKAKGVQQSAPPFLRYHCIDMQGDMDMEYGIPVSDALPDEGRIKAGCLPAGQYASIIFSGGSYQGNKKLVDWIKDNQVPIENWQSEKGDHFGVRYEQYLTDPKVEHRRTKWEILLAFKLKD